jgi:hypothetical protein
MSVVIQCGLVVSSQLEVSRSNSWGWLVLHVRPSGHSVFFSRLLKTDLVEEVVLSWEESEYHRL